MRTLSRWFRVVTPPWWVFVIYLGFVTLLTIASVADRSSHNGMLLFVGLGPAAYGAYRAMYFHPANRNHYRSWLETTPWRHPKPLPFGPVSLVWQDVPVLVAFGVVGMLQHLIVAGLTLSSPQLLPASHVVSILVYVIAIPFFGLYAICVALTIAGTGQSNVAWLMGVGFGVLCRVIAEPWLALVAAFATVVVGHWGVQRSLASYPWPKELLFSRGSPPQGARSKQQPDMGWPYVQLGPDREGRANFLRILSRGRISTGLLIGWWIYAILSHFEYVWAFEGTEEVHSNLWHSCNGLIAVLAAGRLFIYCVSHWPPISFLGRVATGHWIIPGYDQVLVAPVISVAASLCLEILLRSYGVTTQYAMPIVLVSAWSLISSIGPSFETWHFTGSHRLMRW